MMDELLQEMIDPAPQRGDVSRWRRLGATAAIFALAGLGVTSLTTSALFTDRETTAGDLLTGTVDLSLGAFAFPVDTAGMAPGDVRVQALTLTNSGSLELRYAAAFRATNNGQGALPNPADPLYDPADAEAVAGTGDLRDKLTLDVFLVGSTAACTTVATPPAVGRDRGNHVDLTAALLDPSVLDGYTPILGNATTTPFTGSVHLLTPTGSQAICVRAELAQDADNSYQNTSATIDLRLDAEQVINNPSADDPA